MTRFMRWLESEHPSVNIEFCPFDDLEDLVREWELKTVTSEVLQHGRPPRKQRCPHRRGRQTHHMNRNRVS